MNNTPPAPDVESPALKADRVTRNAIIIVVVVVLLAVSSVGVFAWRDENRSRTVEHLSASIDRRSVVLDGLAAFAKVGRCNDIVSRANSKVSATFRVGLIDAVTGAIDDDDALLLQGAAELAQARPAPTNVAAQIHAELGSPFGDNPDDPCPSVPVPTQPEEKR